MDRLDMMVVYATSEDMHFPAREMVRQGPLLAKGWQSARNCEYPQIVGIRFLQGEVHVAKLQILSNDSKVPVRVEVHVAEPFGPNIQRNGEPVSFHSALFRSYGYFTFRNNSASTFRSGELKSLSVEASMLYLKLIFLEPHPHPVNVFQQVGVTSLVALGQVKQLLLPSGSIDKAPSLVSFFKGGFQRDSDSDAQVLAKIEEFEQAKVRMISIEDYESARRIKDQLDELVPLGVILHDHEHRKAKALADEDYTEAQKMKLIVTRVRAYVESLRPGMPFQRFDLDSMIATALGQDTSVPRGAPAGPPLIMASSPHRFVKKPANFDEIPVGGGGGSIDDSQQVSIDRSPPRQSQQPDDDGPFLLSELDEDDRPLVNDLRSCLPANSEGLNPERVSDARASELNGWKHMRDVFGYYWCCCIFSKKFQLREAAFEFIKQGCSDGSVTKLAQRVQRKDQDVWTCILYAVSTPGIGVADSIPSIVFPACEATQKLFRAIGKKVADATLFRACGLAIAKALLVKLGDSNVRLRQVAMGTIETLGESPFVGTEIICGTIVDEKPKNVKQSEEYMKFLAAVVAKLRGGSAMPPVLQLSNVYKKSLKSMLAHANKGVREQAMLVLVEYIRKLGSIHPEVQTVMASIKPAQKLVVEKMLSETTSAVPLVDDHSAEEQSNALPRKKQDQQKTAPPVIFQPRRTLEETKGLNPDLADVYVFKSPAQSKKHRKIASTMAFGPTVESSVIESERMVTPQQPSVLKKKIADALTAASNDAQPIDPVASILVTPTSAHSDEARSTPVVSKSVRIPTPTAQQLSSPSASFHPSPVKQHPPKRRPPPAAVPGRCQFCGESNEEFHDKDALLEHFFGECPMLCTCPLCRLPVEIHEIHWHLAQDCKHKALLKQCPRCYECVRVEEYDEHAAAAKCIAFQSLNFVCPLCHEVLLADDVFWEAHILYPPFCSQNPRTKVADENDMADSGLDEHRKMDSDNDEPSES